MICDNPLNNNSRVLDNPCLNESGRVYCFVGEFDFLSDYIVVSAFLYRIMYSNNILHSVHSGFSLSFKEMLFSNTQASSTCQKQKENCKG